MDHLGVFAPYDSSEITVAVAHAASLLQRLGMEVCWLHPYAFRPARVCSWWDRRVIRCELTPRCFTSGLRCTSLLFAGHNQKALRIAETVATRSQRILLTVSSSDCEPDILMRAAYTAVWTPFVAVVEQLSRQERDCLWSLIPSAIPCFRREGLAQTGQVRLLVWLRPNCMPIQADMWPRVLVQVLRLVPKLRAVVAAPGTLPRRWRKGWRRAHWESYGRLETVWNCTHDDFVDLLRLVDWALFPWQRALFATEASVAFSCGVPILAPRVLPFDLLFETEVGVALPVQDARTGQMREREIVDTLARSLSDLNLLCRVQACADWNHDWVTQTVKTWRQRLFSNA